MKTILKTLDGRVREMRKRPHMSHDEVGGSSNDRKAADMNGGWRSDQSDRGTVMR